MVKAFKAKIFTSPTNSVSQENYNCDWLVILYVIGME